MYSVKWTISRNCLAWRGLSMCTSNTECLSVIISMYISAFLKCTDESIVPILMLTVSLTSTHNVKTCIGLCSLATVILITYSVLHIKKNNFRTPKLQETISLVPSHTANQSILELYIYANLYSALHLAITFLPWISHIRTMLCSLCHCTFAIVFFFLKLTCLL